MIDARRNYLVVGSFVLAMLAGLVVSVAVLSGRRGPTDLYYAVYPNVTGVAYGTQVFFEGYPVGQVEEIVPLRDEEGVRFRVGLSVVRGWKIPRDSVAQVSAPGLLAAFAIDIQAGSSAEALEPGQEIQGREVGNVFELVSSVADELNGLTEGSLRPLIESLAKTVPEIATNLSGFSEELAKSGRRLAELFREENTGSVEKVIRNVEAATGEIAGLASDLDETKRSLDDLLRGGSRLVDESDSDLNQAMEDLRYTLQSVARHVDAVAQNLEATSRNLNEFSRVIRQNPGVLLDGSDPPDVAAGEGE